MEPEKLLQILSQAARLKTTMRHCYTMEGREESVADHSWRIALTAMLMTGIEEFSDINMDRVIRMCLIHDLGESFTGDIPAFVKTDSDTGEEVDLFRRWVDTFPEPQRGEWTELLAEMEALKTREARLYKALDKIYRMVVNKSDSWGNAREMRNLLDATIQRLSMRVSQLKPEEVTKETYQMILPEDIE